MPYLSQEYVFEHFGLAQSLNKNMTFGCYPSGRQVYTFPGTLVELQDDVGAFAGE